MPGCGWRFESITIKYRKGFWTVFFPLYPLLIRALTWVLGDALTAGLAEFSEVILGAAFGVLAWWRLRASYGVYMLASMIMITASSFWQSSPRYLLPLFPIFILMTEWGRRPVVHATMSFVCVALYVLFLGQFIQGGWGF